VLTDMAACVIHEQPVENIGVTSRFVRQTTISRT